MLLESTAIKSQILHDKRNKELKTLKKENETLKEMHKVFRDIIEKKDKAISNLQFILSRGGKK